jgi:hypothetical protein
VKRLTGALLILGIFVSTSFAQSAEQAMKNRRKVLFGWLGTVKTAETKYKSKHGRYGDLTALRESHLLDVLVFESDHSSASAHGETESEASFVPKSTSFQVTISSDGQHFRVTISESLDDRCGVGVFADEMSSGSSVCRPLPMPWEDRPEGPLISLPG